MAPMMSPNRILDYAARVQYIMDTGTKPDGEPVGDLAALEASLSLSLPEIVAFKDNVALAQAGGRLTYEEAMVVQDAIDPSRSDGWAPGTGLAIKVAITNLVGQLVGLKIGA